VSITLIFTFVFLRSTISNNFLIFSGNMYDQAISTRYTPSLNEQVTSHIQTGEQWVRGGPTFSNFKHNLSLMAEFVGLSVSLIVSTVPSTNVRCDEPSKPDMFSTQSAPFWTAIFGTTWNRRLFRCFCAVHRCVCHKHKTTRTPLRCVRHSVAFCIPEE